MTTDEEMKHYFSIIYSMATNIFIIFDNTQFTLGSILRAAGEEQFACNMFLIVYIIIGVPIDLFLIFIVKVNVIGLWIFITSLAICIFFC